MSTLVLFVFESALCATSHTHLFMWLLPDNTFVFGKRRFFPFFFVILLSLPRSPFPSPYPGPDSLIPGAWPRRCVPGGAAEELERGGSNGARGDQLQTRSCRLSSEEGYLSERVWWGGMLTLWVTNGVFICADRELERLTLMVWRPESHNKAGEFTQRTRGWGVGERVGLTDRRPGDQIGTASNCRKRPLDDPRRRWNDAQTFGPKFSWWF